LDKNSPSKKIPIKKDDTVDWNKGDDDVLNMLKKSFKADLNSSEKPKRISVNYLSTLINRPLMYYISTGKMPKVEEYINLIVDTRESFIKKKIIWAINLYYNNFYGSNMETPTLEEIIKFLGIDTYLKCEKDKYEEYTIKLINIISNIHRNK